MTSDEARAISVGQPDVDTGGSAIVEVPFVVEVPPFAEADVPVRITIRARDAAGAQATGFVDIAPGHGVDPVTR